MIATIKAIDRHPFRILHLPMVCFRYTNLTDVLISFFTPFFLFFSFITRQLLHYIRTFAIPVSFVIPTTIITLVHYLFPPIYIYNTYNFRLLSCCYASFQCVAIHLEIGAYLIMYAYTAMLFFCITHYYSSLIIGSFMINSPLTSTGSILEILAR